MEKDNNVLENFIAKKSKRAKEYQEIIEDMMGRYNSYHYAEDTLLGILEYIEKNNDISDAQIQAVENIREKPNNLIKYG